MATPTEGGEDVSDALYLQFIFRKRALKLVAILRKETCNLRHPVHVRRPVTRLAAVTCVTVCVYLYARMHVRM